MGARRRNKRNRATQTGNQQHPNPFSDDREPDDQQQDGQNNRLEAASRIPQPQSHASDYHSANQNDESKQTTSDSIIARWTKILGWSTVCLFFATFGSGVVLYLTDLTLRDTLIETRRAASAAETAADAAKSAVDLSEKTAERQLRAYMSPTGGAITEFDVNNPENPFAAMIVFKNSGQTPAYDFKARAEATFAPFPLDISLRVKDATSGPSITGPGNEYQLRIAIEGLKKEYWEAVRSGSHAIFVNGIYSYTDAFDKVRSGEFRFFYGGKGGPLPSFQLTFHAEGNKAN